jgi:hypothetical protein
MKRSKSDTDPIAKEIIRRNSALKAKRSTWSNLWQDISNYVMPRKSQITERKTEGIEGFTDEIYDTTAQRANTMLAAGQMSYCTPSQDRWFRYDPPEFIKEAGGHAAKVWFDKCTEIAMRELARSNFYVEVHEFYLDRGAFGTALLYCEEGKRTALNFTTLDVGTFSCAEDDEGLVDTVFCEKTMTVRQMAQKFGSEKLGPNVLKKFDSDNPEDLDCEFTVIHAIFPREDLKEGDEPRADMRDPEKLDAANKRIASIYVCVEDKNVLRNSGYDEMPALVSRFLKWGKQPYGFSPSIEALPTVRQVNFIEKAMDALAETAAFPRMLIPEGMDGQVDMRAAGVTIFDPNTPNHKPEVWGTEGRYDIGKDRVEVKRQMIREAYHNDLFRMFADLDKQITAYEAMQRAAEKLVQFSPTFSRMETEVFNFLLQRMFGILFRAGVFPEPPREVFVPTEQGFALAMPEVVYTSRIALAIRALQNRAFLEFVGIIQPLLAIDPSIMDNFDLDKAAKGVAENVALPMEWQRSEEDVAAMRQQRAEKQAQMEQVAMVQGMAKAGKDAAAAAPEIRKGKVA